MSYATPANLRAWFIQDRLERYLPPPETGENALIQQALDVASAEMDGAFQAGDYAVPVDVVTAPLAAERAELLRRHCMSLALDTLRLSLDGMPENLQAQVAASRRWLRDVRGLQGMRPDGNYGRVVSFADLPGLARSS